VRHPVRSDVDSELDDIHLTTAFSGLPTNMLRPSMLAQGLDPAEFGIGTPQFTMDRLSGNGAAAPRRYRDIWSAGHSVSGVRDVPDVADVVSRLAAEYAPGPGRHRWLSRPGDTVTTAVLRCGAGVLRAVLDVLESRVR
jgi:hypothetical protein